MSKKLAPEVGLVWEVMTCLGLRTTYDSPDSACQWFNNNYGPYPAFSPCDSGQPGEETGNRRWKDSFRAVCKGRRYNVPESA